MDQELDRDKLYKKNRPFFDRAQCILKEICAYDRSLKIRYSGLVVLPAVQRCGLGI